MKKIFLCMLCMLGMFVGKVSAQQNDVKFYALFVRNFAKNIYYDVAAINTCTIYVVNDQQMHKQLEDLTSHASERKYIVQHVDKYTDIEGEPDFIVIGVNASKSIAQISKMFQKSFTVSMKSGQCYENGACVSFSTKNGRPTYDISQKNIERHGIKVIAKLYELGNKID